MQTTSSMIILRLVYFTRGVFHSKANSKIDLNSFNHTLKFLNINPRLDDNIFRHLRTNLISSGLELTANIYSGIFNHRKLCITSKSLMFMELPYSSTVHVIILHLKTMNLRVLSIS